MGDSSFNNQVKLVKLCSVCNLERLEIAFADKKLLNLNLNKSKNAKTWQNII